MSESSISTRLNEAKTGQDTRVAILSAQRRKLGEIVDIVSLQKTRNNATFDVGQIYQDPEMQSKDSNFGEHVDSENLYDASPEPNRRPSPTHTSTIRPAGSNRDAIQLPSAIATSAKSESRMRTRDVRNILSQEGDLAVGKEITPVTPTITGPTRIAMISENLRESLRVLDEMKTARVSKQRTADEVFGRAQELVGNVWKLNIYSLVTSSSRFVKVSNLRPLMDIHDESESAKRTVKQAQRAEEDTHKELIRAIEELTRCVKGP
ncbi:hypothetical protein G7Y89_g10809 [Cudoniella acicularis]|uniref:Uncharacterized protein n=1 Tax=Cudoniella acicularis TaxID=354080 RepID=A0A8H4RC17_9HELO|nr:hypothetical protein G7Y89_g10809 [Cudoniella acicularis]